MYTTIGNHEKALEQAREVMLRGARGQTLYLNLGTSYINLNRWTMRRQCSRRQSSVSSGGVPGGASLPVSFSEGRHSADDADGSDRHAQFTAFPTKTVSLVSPDPNDGMQSNVRGSFQISCSHPERGFETPSAGCYANESAYLTEPDR